MTVADNREALRVLHLTDPHLFADSDGALRGAVTRETLERVLGHYEASGWDADRVIVTGDLIQDDSPGAYQRFRELMSRLNLRVHCVPGNHDVRDLMQKVCRAPPFSYCAYEEVRDWLLVGIDSCVRGQAGGEVSDAELDRLERIVSESSARHVLVGVHHPPVPMGSAWLDSVGMRNGPALVEKLQSLGRVRLALFGHAHQQYDGEHDGVRIVGTPSTCRQFKPASDEFAVDDKPPAYRRITLYPDGNTDAELVWVGA